MWICPVGQFDNQDKGCQDGVEVVLLSESDPVVLADTFLPRTLHTHQGKEAAHSGPALFHVPYLVFAVVVVLSFPHVMRGVSGASTAVGEGVSTETLLARLRGEPSPSSLVGAHLLRLCRNVGRNIDTGLTRG